MPQQHNLGNLTKLYYSLNVTTPVWVRVFGLQSMDPPGISWGDVERKLLDLDFKETRPGKMEGEDGTISLEYSGSNAFIQLIDEWIDDGLPPVIRFGVVFEDGSDIQWNGYCKGAKPKDVDDDSQVGFDVPYKVTGKPKYTETSTISVTP